MKIFKTNFKKNISKKLLSQKEKDKLKPIIDFLCQGKIVIFPTDTVYGMLADATNKITAEKIFKIKKRSAKKSFPIFVKNFQMAEKFAKINKKQKKLLKKVWPGKITVILNRKKSKIKIYGIDKKTIALRIPTFPPLNFILSKLNFPLIATSANISNKPPLIKTEDIQSQFKASSDLIISANCFLRKFQRKNKPSSILDITTSPPTIIRI